MIKSDLEEQNEDYALDNGFFFFVAFIPWVITLSLYTNTYFIQYIPINLVYIVRGFSLMVLVMRELFNNRFSLNTVFISAFLLFSALVCYKSNDFQLFDIIFFACSCRNIKFKNVVMVYFACQLFVFITTIVACLHGILPNIMYFQDGRIRNSLGYGYTTLPSQTFFYLSASYLYIRKEKLSIIELIIIEIGALVLYKESVTRNPFIMTTFLVIVSLVLKIVKYNFMKLYIIKLISKWTMVVMPFIAIMTAYFYNGNSFFSFLDKIFSNRLTLSHNGLINFGVTALGQKVDFTGLVNPDIGTTVQYNYIDSSYVQLLVVRGFLFIFVLFFFFHLIGRKLAENSNQRNIYLVVILFAISIHSLFDPQLTYLWYSPFILLIGYVFNDEFSQKRISWNLF
jgi:hypothetical protein